MCSDEHNDNALVTGMTGANVPKGYTVAVIPTDKAVLLGTAVL